MEERKTTVTVSKISLSLEILVQTLNTALPRCLGHVINLGNIDVMGDITKIAAVENATAIWEYDSICKDNHVLEDSLDVIAAIRTLAIKVSLALTGLSYILRVL